MAWLSYRREEMNQTITITTRFENCKQLANFYVLLGGCSDYCYRFCAILYVNSLISCSTIRLGIIGFSSILIDFRSRLSKVEVIVMLLWKAATAWVVCSKNMCRLGASCKDCTLRSECKKLAYNWFTTATMTGSINHEWESGLFRTSSGNHGLCLKVWNNFFVLGFAINVRA